MASEPNLAVFDLELKINTFIADREQALSSTKRNCSMKLPLTTACTNAAVIYVFNIMTDQDLQSSASRSEWTSSNAAYGRDLAENILQAKALNKIAELAFLINGDEFAPSRI